MNKLKKITKSRNKIKRLCHKQDKVFHDLLDQIGGKEPRDISVCDFLFDYLYNGTEHSFKELEKYFSKNERKMAWWQR
jgi:hypothetical protein